MGRFAIGASGMASLGWTGIVFGVASQPQQRPRIRILAKAALERGEMGFRQCSYGRCHHFHGRLGRMRVLCVPSDARVAEPAAANMSVSTSLSVQHEAAQIWFAWRRTRGSWGW